MNEKKSPTVPAANINPTPTAATRPGPVPATGPEVVTSPASKIPSAPIGLGVAVGKKRTSYPCELRCPVDGITDPNLYPVAIFHLYVWDFSLVGALTEAGVPPLPNQMDPESQARQGEVVAPMIIDVDKGWENLPRFDGSQWEYVRPSDDEIGTPADPRVQLSYVASFFNSVKALSVELAFKSAKAIEKNSAASSEVTTDEVAPYVANHPRFKSE